MVQRGHLVGHFCMFQIQSLADKPLWTTFSTMLWVRMRIKSYSEGQLDERQRVLNAIQEIEEGSHKTRTPLFQDTLLSLIREAINGKESIANQKRQREVS